jgi:hypothetical protein
VKVEPKSTTSATRSICVNDATQMKSRHAEHEYEQGYPWYVEVLTQYDDGETYADGDYLQDLAERYGREYPESDFFPIFSFSADEVEKAAEESGDKIHHAGEVGCPPTS